MSAEFLTVLGTDIEAVESGGPRLDDGELLRLYEALLTARLLDDRCVQLHTEGRIGFYVSSRGDEAVSAGSASVLHADDWAFPSHRDLAMYLLRGGSLRSWLDQLFANADDLTRGRQMPGHHSLPAGRFVSVSSPIGTQIVQAAGCALAMSIRGARNAALASFGAAAVAGNDFHAAMNLAGSMRLPVVFVCRNPVLAGAPTPDRLLAGRPIVERAAGYGVRAVRVDGTDLLAVVKAVGEARENAVLGAGATLIEALTDGRAMSLTSDVETAAPAAGEGDPVVRFRSYLELRGAWNPAGEEEMRSAIDERLDDAVAAASSASRPAPDTLLSDVFDEPPWMLQEQGQQLRDASSTGATTPAREPAASEGEDD